jgi:succinyl-CoA synthetase beta subunit
MKIHEYQGKQLFEECGIAISSGRLATTAAQARAIVAEFGTRCAVKAQVHIGGRGKAGGVKLAGDADEAEQLAGDILGMDIKGHTVRKVWVEQAVDIAREAYLAIMLDRTTKRIAFICSAEGGIDIEEVAETQPEKIHKIYTDSLTFPATEAKAVAGKLFDDESTAAGVLDVMEKLFKFFCEKDASLAEINPLVLTGGGEVVALDGKVNFDDNALYRHPEIVELRDMDEENEAEIDAKTKGLSFVQLDGNIGCMVNGAGLAMATMDMIKLSGGDPANFLDVGGSSNPEKVVHAFNLILANPDVKAILINIFGGITRCDDIARGILESFNRIDINVPVVIRLCGTNEKEGLELLKDTNLETAQTLAEGVGKAIRLAG